MGNSLTDFCLTVFDCNSRWRKKEEKGGQRLALGTLRRAGSEWMQGFSLICKLIKGDRSQPAQ